MYNNTSNITYKVVDPIPFTASSKDIQRDYRTLFDLVKKKKRPLFVLNHNEPDVVILDLKTYKKMQKHIKQLEDEHFDRIIHEYEKEKAAGELKELRSLADLR